MDVDAMNGGVTVVLMVPRTQVVLPSQCTVLLFGNRSTQKHWNTSPSLTNTDVAKGNFSEFSPAADVARTILGDLKV